ncbi:hypothetical protein [Nocardioides taihuensis]|uniref:DUF2085 domain-containing protein n=1 Tax=Nocardioides taihuensis TaxID=1835606 RepID=A0ABW0BEF7_9ACTN
MIDAEVLPGHPLTPLCVRCGHPVVPQMWYVNSFAGFVGRECWLSCTLGAGGVVVQADPVGRSVRSIVARMLVVSAAVVLVGGVVAWASSARIHDWGEISFNTTGSRLGLALLGAGALAGVSLAIASVVAGVWSPTRPTSTSLGATDSGRVTR